MSADSGLATFRDSGGLWEGFDIHEVASVDGWRRNPVKILEFYNNRRKQALNAQPNKGHFAVATLEEQFRVTVITQNVDDLHERSGSSRVIHLHGELCKARSVRNSKLVKYIGPEPIHMGDTAEDGAQLRPHIVWFGESVPLLEEAMGIMETAQILIVIGTSLVVYPAAGLIDYVPAGIPRYLIDPSEPGRYLTGDWQHLKTTAAKGTPELVTNLFKLDE
ncbi:MAG: Sir2 family NAD-dependent protein deacetylase [Balneolaceae bacterium]